MKNKYRWNFLYGKSLALAAADEIQKQHFIENGISKKCLVLDCDNVLWGGILSEEGMENIRLGSSRLGLEYQEFQRFVLSLYYRGVILRENKSDNIRHIADKLNIGTGSMVFVDDSPFEMEEVNTFLPEVTTILYHRETMYKEFCCFHLKENFDGREVAKRNHTYRTEVYRQEIKEKCDSYKDYLVALEMKVDIHEILPDEYGRIAELTQRTNKCTNGVRCTVANIKEWASSSVVHLYTVTLADKFSDLGIVGVFGVQECKLLLFSLSCRALGREIEGMMLNYIQEKYGVTEYEFRDTGKNGNLKVLFKEVFHT